MNRIFVINGPNLNMLGIREPEMYGSSDYADLVAMIEKRASELGVDVECFQSNHEGEIVDAIQRAYFNGFDGIIINPAAYSHTSVAILDALKAVMLPAAEVHITDINTREGFRKVSYAGMACEAHFVGLGFDGYIKALEYLAEK